MTLIVRVTLSVIYLYFVHVCTIQSSTTGQDAHSTTISATTGETSSPDRTTGSPDLSTTSPFLTTTNQEQTTSSPDACTTDPCANGGSCGLVGGLFECDCSQGYTGIRCETFLNPCNSIPSPCPEKSDCFATADSFYCICQGNFTGSQCDQIDILITCKEFKIYRHLLKDNNAPVLCVPNNNTRINDPLAVCHDPDDAIIYKLSHNPRNLFFLENKSVTEETCLYVNVSEVDSPYYCLNLTAYEADDIDNRTWRNSRYDFCVVFNEKPVLTLDTILTTVNIAGSSVGDPVFSTSASDPFGLGAFSFMIKDVEPKEWKAYFKTSSGQNKTDITWKTLPATIDIPNQGQDVVFTVQVDDGGRPPLRAEVNVTVKFINASLSCGAVEDVYVGLQIPPTGAIVGKISCIGVTSTSDLQYTLDPNGFTNLTIKDNGDIELDATDLKQGVYNVTVTITGPFVETSIKFTIYADYYELNCPESSEIFNISESKPVGNCIDTHQCNSEILPKISPPCSTKLSGSLSEYLELNCQTFPTGAIIQICVNKSMMSQWVEGLHQLFGELKTDYGVTNITLDVNVLNVNEPPVFVPSSNYEVTINEHGNLGSSVLVLSAADPDKGDYLTYALNGNDVIPFTVQENGVISISKTLNATERTSYSFQVKVTDTGGMSALATVTIQVEDVNEAPVCQHPNNQYVIVIQANTSANTVIGEMDCYDVDTKTAFKAFSYSLLNTSDMFSVSASGGQITLTRVIQPADSDSYTYNVSVTDNGGLSTVIEVTIKINSNFPPSCPSDKHTSTLSEDSSLTDCVSMVTNCADPLAGDLQFSVQGLNGSTIFQTLPNSRNDPLQICPRNSLKGKYGVWSLNIQVDNGFGVTFIRVDITVSDVNDPPTFPVSSKDVQISERIQVGNVVTSVAAEDHDSGRFSILTYSFVNQQVDFSVNLNNGSIMVRQRLNASVTHRYELVIEAIDGGGLNATLPVTIHVTDENDPPVCESPVQVYVNLTTPVGTAVGKLNCWDWDISSNYGVIHYDINQQQAVVFQVKMDGTIQVSQNIPRTLTDYNFDVTVRDGYMTTSGNFTGQTMVVVAVNVNADYPPVCSETDITGSFLETQPVNDCLDKEVTCTDITGGAVSVIQVGGTGTTITHVRNRTNEIPSQLPLNLCVKENVKNYVGQKFEVYAMVDNGLAITQVNWKFEIKDVNEPPVFIGAPYNFSVYEKQTPPVEISSISVVDNDFEDLFKTFSTTTINTIPGNSSAIAFVQASVFAFVQLNATERDLYEFEITATDGGKLTSTTTAVIHVLDVNEAPICDTRSVQIPASLLTAVNDVLYMLSCYDTDRDLNNRLLNYAVKSTVYFNVDDTGKITLATKLNRFTTVYNFSVEVKDSATVPLSILVDVSVTVNNKIPAVCQQANMTYPDKWVINSCVIVAMNCIDPVSEDSSQLTYALSGNYTAGFTETNLGKGQYRFCYKLITSNTFMVIVQVYNGLQSHFEYLPFEVLYDQSTPQFTSSSYPTTVAENAVTGTSLLVVRASIPTGTIVYSITGGDITDWNNYFQIDSTTGTISTRSSVMPLSDTQVKLTVQALNDFSKLKSTAQVVINIIDINEAPSCIASASGDINLNVDVAVGTILRQYSCSDPDIDELNKKLVFTLVVFQGADSYFGLDVSGNNISVKVMQPLAVTKDTYALSFVASDSATIPKNATFHLNVIVNLTPPLPIVSAYAINSSIINIRWNYDREDYYTVTTNFYIILTSTSDRRRQINMKSDHALNTYNVTDLIAETTYQIVVIALTPYGNTTTQAIIVTTAAIPKITSNIVTFKLTSEPYEPRLNDPFSFAYVQLKSKVEGAIRPGLRDTAGFVDIAVIAFRSGSVKVDMTISTNQSGNPNDTAQVLQKKISTGWIGNLAVDPNYFVIGSGDGYIRVTSLTSNPVSLVNNSRIVFTCVSELVGQVGQVSHTWMLNLSPITPSRSSRWSISSETDDPNKPGQKIYTLTVSPIYHRDQGTLSCKVSDDSGLSSSMSISMAVTHQPIIIISPRSKTLSKGENVDISCVVESPLDTPATIMWYRNGNKITQFSAAESVTVRSQYAEILSVKNLQSRVVYGCTANNTAGQGLLLTADIGVIINYKCDKNLDDEGTIWEITVEGSTDVKNCPRGRTGTATRACVTGGVWGDPDYSGCVSQDLLNIEAKTKKLKEGLMVETLQNVVSDLANLTGSTQTDFVEGEIDVTMTVFENVAEYGTDHVEEVTDTTLDQMIQCASDLLDPRYFREWDIILKKNKNGASRVMKSVGEISITSTKRSQASSRLITKKNIVVQNRKVENEDVLFPDRSKNNYPDWVEKEALARISRASLGQGQFWTSGVIYRNITELLQKNFLQNNKLSDMIFDVNSHIIDVTVDRAPKVFDPPIEFTLPHIGDNYSNPQCVWWDFSVSGTPNGAWSPDGCVVYSTSDWVTVCKCDHLTNFAILMSPGKTPEHHILPLSIISAIGCGLSILFLLITVGVYIAFWRYVKSDRSVILMNLCVALILAYIIFLAGVNRTENKDICTAVAALLHYFFLVVFFMMLAEGIEIAVSVLYVFSTKSRISWLMPLGWFISAVIVGISLGATQLKGYGNSEFCWLSLEDGLLWAFVVPALFVIIVNIVIVFLVLKAMFSSHTMMTKTHREQTKSAIRSLCVILPIMGVTWVLGVFSINEDLVYFQYIFAVCNTLQGFFIFLFHCLLNRQVHDAIKHNRRRKKSIQEFTKSTSHGHSNTKTEKERDSSDTQNNIEIEKKANPFLEADRQVQEMVGKLSKKNDKNNAFAVQKENEKNIDKDNILSLDDIKISNIVRESENAEIKSGSVPSNPTSGSALSSSQNSGKVQQTGSDRSRGQQSGSDRGQHSGSDRGQHSGSDRGQHSGSDRGQHSGSDRGQHSGSDRGQHSGSDRGQHSGSDRGQLSGMGRTDSGKLQGQVNPAFRSSVASSHQYDEPNSFYLGSTGEQPFSSSHAVTQPTNQKAPSSSQAFMQQPTPSYQQQGQRLGPSVTQPTNHKAPSSSQASMQQPTSSYQQQGQRSGPSQDRQRPGTTVSSSYQRLDQNPAPTSQPMKTVIQSGFSKPVPFSAAKGGHPVKSASAADVIRSSQPRRYGDDIEPRRPTEGKGYITYMSTEKTGSGGRSRDKKGKEQKYSPKAQRKNMEHEPSQRKGMPHWGKAKQAAAAKKQMKSHGGDRSRSQDRAKAYAVPIDPYYEQPYARHPSLENVSVQYVGFDPFGGVPQQYGRPSRSRRYDPWDEPRVDYW